MNASTDFKEFAKRTAAELDACALKSKRFAQKEFYADECAAASSYGITWELREDGVFKDELDEKIAGLIFNETSCFVNKSARPLSVQALREIHHKLANAVRLAKRGWFAEQTAIAV